MPMTYYADFPEPATAEGSIPEALAESIRHQYFLQIQGGRLVPAAIAIGKMERVLDLGCGSGEWIFALSSQYPRLQICGVDVRSELLQQARARRNTGSLRRIEFRQMDCTPPLKFSARSFDYIHMRARARQMQRQTWPPLLEEALRVLRPGGWLNLVELELCASSSPAFMELQRALNATWLRLGHALDPSGLSFGAASRLYGMLRAAGFTEVAYEAYSADLGPQGGAVAARFLAVSLAEVQLAGPLIIQQQILSAAALSSLLAQATTEVRSPDHCGWGMLISAYGRRAEGSEPS
jgi:ubiquinone/menaquinone biosynthesis C-methylase UbiE